MPFNGYGKELAQRLGAEGIRPVVLAKTRKGLAEATELGLMGVIGDIDDPDSFAAAGIDRASYVVACDWDDMRNAIVAITARSWGEHGVKVVSVVNDPENEDKMRILKVDAVVMPEPLRWAPAGTPCRRISRDGLAGPPCAPQCIRPRGP